MLPQVLVHEESVAKHVRLVTCSASEVFVQGAASEMGDQLGSADTAVEAGSWYKAHRS